MLILVGAKLWIHKWDGAAEHARGGANKLFIPYGTISCGIQIANYMLDVPSGGSSGIMLIEIRNQALFVL